MDSVVLGMFLLQGLFWAACIVLLIVLIFKRLEDKKNEDLDEYDN